jgi:carbon storage regulator CsrA
MLVLSRRPNEKIVLPGIDTTIQVVTVRPGVVRLGIEAPPNVAVVRAELLEQGDFQWAAANGTGTTPLRELRHAVQNRLNSVTIGLALLRRQVQAGHLESLESTLDRIDREVQQLRRHVEGVQETPAVKPPAGKPRRALLVEDDHNERELLAGFLRLAGYAVDTAGDGADALDYLRDQGRPDVMLLDMLLPRVDGPTTVQAVRRDPAYQGLKIFAVSGCPPDQFDLTAQGHVDRWFRKPIDPEALLRELNRDLEARNGVCGDVNGH